MSDHVYDDGTARPVLEAIAGSDAGLRSALVEAGLPVDDLEEPERNFFRLSRDGSLLAFGGYERHGENALLRSIVVLPAHRRQGIGEMMAKMLLERARLDGARRAYLLTTTAAPFFEASGFRKVARTEVPAAILATRQASALCPQSATILEKMLSAQHDDL